MEKRAEMAFKETVKEVIDEHARLGLPLHLGGDGKVVELSPAEVRALSRSNHRKRSSRALCKLVTLRT
jgi:hypothetical protein